MSDALNKINDSFRTKRKEIRRKHKALALHEGKLAAIFKDVEALGGEPYSDGDWIYIPLAGDKNKFLAFARLIAKHGFDVPKVAKGETGFNVLHSLGEGDGHLYLYFSFSSTACRRVKIGTKLVEQNVFETVCDEVYPHGDVEAA